MAAPTSTFQTVQAIGDREDLADIIYNVDPTETPFISNVKKGKATAVNHEWQTQALAAVDSANAQIEGDDAANNAVTPTVRLGNQAQISRKVAQVSGTQQVVDKAGRDDEMDYQMVLKGKELKRDMETILVGTNQAKVSRTATVAGKLASILSWIGTNDDFGAGAGASPTTLDGAATRTDGTQRAFTEASLKNAQQLIWTSGGDPGTIMVGGFNKQAFSTFTGRATPTEDTTKKKITASVDVYEGDFGTQKVLANRFMRSRDALILEMDYWEVDYLRNMRTIELAKTGDSFRKMVLCEYTLAALNEKSSGGVFDLTTS